MKRSALLMLLVLIATACSPGLGGLDEQDVTGKAHRVTVSTPKNPKLVVGDTATITASGNTMTVYSYESSLAAMNSMKPESGFEFSAIEAEACASSSSGRDLMEISPDAFSLRYADGTLVRPEIFEGRDVVVEKPALRTMDPEPGTCTRGFIAYQTPRGESPELLIFEGQFASEDPSISWKIPDA